MGLETCGDCGDDGGIIMKILIPLLLSLFAALPLFSQESAPYREAKTGLVFPAKLGGMQFQYAEPCDTEDSKGTSIAYSHPEGIQATVFVFERPGINVPDGAESPEIQAELKDMKNMVRYMVQMGNYSDVELYDAKPQRLGSDGQGQFWATAAFTGKMKGQPIMSFMFITGYKGQYVKLRLSSGNPEAEVLDLFPKALGDLLVKK